MDIWFDWTKLMELRPHKNRQLQLALSKALRFLWLCTGMFWATSGLAWGFAAHRKIVNAAKTEDFRFSSIILGITKSVPFQMRARANGEKVAIK